MVSATDPFLAEAIRIGRDIAGGAMRSRGQATWLADEIALVDGRPQPTVGTLGPDLAAGTAGVGWFLARLAAIADDQALAGVAAAALRHAVKRAETLTAAGRLDWYRGAGGVAWAAIDAGRALGSDELVAEGMRAADAVVSAAAERGRSDPALVGGAAGEIAALLALAATGGSEAARQAATRRAQALADAIPPSAAPRMPASRALEPADATPAAAAARQAATQRAQAPADAFPSGDAGQRAATQRAQAPADAIPASAAGLATGLSGIGLVLAAAGERDAAGSAFAAERALFEPGLGWLAPAAHDWVDTPAVPDASWCRGAAGIGLARLAARATTDDLMLLAEASAAVELVRGHLAAPSDPDASLCHGAAGAIELLLSAGALLGEPTHTQAARVAGRALIERSWSRGRYAGGFGPRARNPSLLFGLAGTATLLLRLHDPDSVPSPALPPL